MPPVTRARARKSHQPPARKQTEKKQTKKQHRLTADEQEMAAFAPVPETIRPGLDILFVGINPGYTSGYKQLHFGNPQNYFWKGLFESDLIPEPIPPEQGHLLHEKWNMSIVNLVQRTTRSTSDLSAREMREAVPELCRKITANPPKIVCFVGKGIYQVFANAKQFELGLQREVYEFDSSATASCPPLQPGKLEQGKFAYLFAMPSTSGRTAAYQNAEKLLFFRQLKYIRDCAGSGIEPDPEHLQDIGPRTRSRYFVAR
ncbi:DNA glycosylase [Linderina pennispora]|uniref:DNA glycosylase n=1 Tax=Linderina pennispora TaxID=61395 RepID=A0A1Y1WKQ5_9FUNG|nr:DNA glycosylase [Linderina pennispora]ORX74160.1 DNA glycosylase [Linderina pennispora]